mgnify:CR=1 FL=1
MKKSLNIIGYSGHSFVCIEAAETMGIEISGYYDIKENLLNPYKLKYLGKENNIKKEDQLFISIGDNNIRKKVFEKIIKNNSLDCVIIHQKSIVSYSASIDKQTLINAGSIVNSRVLIGKGCIVNTGSFIDHECEIGQFSHIAPGATLAGNVIVGENCFIGANSTVIQGVKIGDNVIVGAGTVIIKDIPNNSTIVGNPARIIK